MSTKKKSAKKPITKVAKAAKKTKKSAVRNLTCHICEKKVEGVSVLAHLWDKHRAKMMKNRAHGPRKAKETAAVPKTVKTRVKAVGNLVEAINYEIAGMKLGKQSAESALKAIQALIS